MSTFYKDFTPFPIKSHKDILCEIKKLRKDKKMQEIRNTSVLFMNVRNVMPVNRTEIAVSLQNCVRSQKNKTVESPFNVLNVSPT